MLGEEQSDDRGAAGSGGRTDGGSGGRRGPLPYSRSVSWTDRSPVTRRAGPAAANKPRSLLPPLQPLSISRRSVEEWPSAGSDDLGVWVPQTPRGSIGTLDSGQPGNDFQLKKDKLAFFDKECSRIADHVYLGSDTVAKNHELLRQNKITHVLNCVGFVCPEYFKSDFVYKTLWLQDSPTEDITSILYDVFDYFEDVRQQGGRVLVHCCQGVSRSTSLVIAYLMWREGQSFEDAFQFVKTARGVTNPNMGFAGQLLQCQKRVHAVPASPNSMLRMYRMAPHSSYDPLHLVPKVVNQPCARALDSRGAFIVHVPSAIYVWTGKNCNSVMSCNARSAAFQVIHYEKATGPILSIHEDEEPREFWIALSNEQLLSIDCDKKEVALNHSERMEVDGTVDMGVRPRKVADYDLDYEIFHKALAGGVVPAFSVSNAGWETCLPARENGWGRLRRKLANGLMKGLFTSSKQNSDTSSSNGGQTVMVEVAKQQSPVEVMDHFVPSVNSSLPPSPPATSDSLPCFLSSSPRLCSKSPTLSPSSSDYASSFTFSPSSTNWSSQQPSPSSLESTEPFIVKDTSFSESSFLLDRKCVFPSSEDFLANQNLGAANSYFTLKGSSPSIAERRGSNPPPLMLLTSVNESSNTHKNKILVRSQSFSLPELDDNLMKDVSCNQFDHENSADLKH